LIGDDRAIKSVSVLENLSPILIGWVTEKNDKLNKEKAANKVIKSEGPLGLGHSMAKVSQLRMSRISLTTKDLWQKYSRF